MLIKAGIELCILKGSFLNEFFSLLLKKKCGTSSGAEKYCSIFVHRVKCIIVTFLIIVQFLYFEFSNFDVFHAKSTTFCGKFAIFGKWRQ
jgi:hypothetical protein